MDLPGKSIANNDKEFIDDVPEAEWKKFSEAVKKNKGKAVVIVHPFYDNRPQEAYFKTIAAVIEKCPAVAILEGQENIANLKEFLKTRNASRCLVLPTLDGNPRLAHREFPFGSGRVAPNLAGLLSSKAGVKKVFVGGMYSHGGPHDAHKHIVRHDDKWLPERLKSDYAERKVIFMGCAGTVYNELIASGKFGRVRIMPNAVYPDKPMYQKAKNHDEIVARIRRESKKRKDAGNTIPKKLLNRR